MKKKVTEKEKFSELLEMHPELNEFLFEKGMFCVGCPMGSSESLKEGALAHGLDPKKLIKEINEKLKN